MSYTQMNKLILTMKYTIPIFKIRWSLAHKQLRDATAFWHFLWIESNKPPLFVLCMFSALIVTVLDCTTNVEFIKNVHFFLFVDSTASLFFTRTCWNLCSKHGSFCSGIFSVHFLQCIYDIAAIPRSPIIFYLNNFIRTEVPAQGQCYLTVYRDIVWLKLRCS